MVTGLVMSRCPVVAFNNESPVLAMLRWNMGAGIMMVFGAAWLLDLITASRKLHCGGVSVLLVLLQNCARLGLPLASSGTAGSSCRSTKKVSEVASSAGGGSAAG